MHPPSTSPQQHTSNVPEENKYERRPLNRNYMKDFDEDYDDYDEDHVYGEDDNDSEGEGEEEECINQNVPAQGDKHHGRHKDFHMTYEKMTYRSRSQTPKLYPDLSPLLGKEEKTKNSNSRSVVFLALIAAVLIISLYFYLLSPILSPKRPLSDKEFIKELLKGAFTQKYSISKKIIFSALKQDLQENFTQVQPAVLLLLSSQEAIHVSRNFSSCLAKHLDSSYMHWSSDSRGLHETLENYFKENEQNRIVLIEDLHVIPFEEAKALQFYCDETSAPYKRAVFIMTAVVNEIIPSKASSLTLDTLASKVLNEAWKDSHEDQRSALLSRITVGVAAVGPDLSLSKC